MSTNHIKKQISNTVITLVPTGHRAYGLKTWRAILVNGDDLRTGFQVATISQLENGDFLPEAMERLRLNVKSLEENDMAWGVYHRFPRAAIESPFGGGAVPATEPITPRLRPECVLTPGARIDHYQNHKDSLFIEVPSGDGEDAFCYQVFDPHWMVVMAGILNAQRKLSTFAVKKPMLLENVQMDAAIEDEVAHLISSVGAPEMLSAVVNASRWPAESLAVETVVQEVGIHLQDMHAYAMQLYESAHQAFKAKLPLPCWKRAATSGAGEG